MAATHAINVDLAKILDDEGKLLRVAAWGDGVELDSPADADKKEVKVRTVKMVEQPDGSVKPKNIVGTIRQPAGGPPVVVPVAQSTVLKVNFVDVQQGDGSVIETPRGRLILVDGGDNQLFARYLANRFRGTTLQNPRDVDCVLVTHGDADHFLGLTEIHQSESHDTPHKRLFIRPRRVYHNGLVKRPSSRNGKKVSDTELLGETVDAPGKKKVIVGLVDSLLDVPDAEMNAPFKAWKSALRTYENRYAAQTGPIEFRRLEQGMDDAFGFLADEEISVEVLGPLTTTVNGRKGLRFLGDPPKGIKVGHDPDHPQPPKFSGFSASHTINGHSVIIRLRYGNFRFLFAGDLNEEAEMDLVENHAAKLRAEVFKVPHHGSADFSTDFMKAVCPVLSVVSSGDESSRKEFIHPRASLMGALGRFSRLDKPLILVTEMVAFFEMMGYVDPERHEMKEGVALVKGGKAVELKKFGRRFFAFNRKAFGLVKVRTDGKRLLVCTDSGNVAMKEAYAYQADANGEPVPDNVIQA
jgi:hypothetical protein